MDFQPQMNPLYSAGEAMPFFMAYPGYACIARQERLREDPAYEDFEYLRRAYPAVVAKMQRRVEEILDRMDYEGSMIYDEYPDRLSLQNLGEAVGQILKTQNGSGEDNDENIGQTTLEQAYLQGLAQVLTCNEIYRRRQKRKQGTNGRITTGFGRNLG